MAARKKSHKVKSRRRSHRRKAGFGSREHRLGAGKALLLSRYTHAKREYHRLGDAVYRANHHGRSAPKRRAKSKRRRARR